MWAEFKRDLELSRRLFTAADWAFAGVIVAFLSSPVVLWAVR